MNIADIRNSCYLRAETECPRKSALSHPCHLRAEITATAHWICPLELTRNPHCRVLGNAISGKASWIRHSAPKPPKKWKAPGHWLLLAAKHCRNLELDQGQGPEAGDATSTAGAGCWKAEHAAGACSGSLQREHGRAGK